MAPLDVVHVCFGGLGGHMSVINSLTKELAPLGIATGVLAVAPDNALSLSREAWPDVDVFEPVAVKGRGDFSSMARIFQLGRSVSGRVVLLHTHRHATPLALSRIVSRQPLNLVTVEHHSLNLRSASDNVNSASALLWSGASVFLTEEYRVRYPLRQFRLPGMARQAVIGNGIDLTSFTTNDRTSRDSARRPVFGMAARLVPSKDVDTLLDAMVLLSEGADSWRPRLRIAGDGPEKQRLELRASDLGLEQDVSFTGVIAENDMPRFLGELDVYVLPTFGETLNMSLLQAAASHVPVVATRVDGIKNVFTDGKDALLVEPRNPRSLASALRKACNPAVARGLSMAAHELVRTRYSSVTMARSYLQLLARIDPKGPWYAARATLDDRYRIDGYPT